MALPAGFLGIGFRSMPGRAEIKVRPFVGKAAVLDLNSHARKIGLEMPALINRPLGLGFPFFYHEDGLVRPFSAAQEFAIRLLRNEDVREQLLEVGSRGMVHS